MEIALQKWGNSQGIRLSKAILKDLGITSEKATFEVEVKDKELICFIYNKEVCCIQRLINY